MDYPMKKPNRDRVQRKADADPYRTNPDRFRSNAERWFRRRRMILARKHSQKRREVAGS